MMTDPTAPGEKEMTPYEELMAYAEETIAETEGWHGELLDAATVEQRHGITADCLMTLYRDQQVIGFGDEANGDLVFPDAQFIDGKVVDGIKSVRAVVKFVGETWLWLLYPSPYLDGDIPLDQLKLGNVAAVVEAAHMQYDL
jgi:hypothetical protein